MGRPTDNPLDPRNAPLMSNPVDKAPAQDTRKGGSRGASATLRGSNSIPGSLITSSSGSGSAHGSSLSSQSLQPPKQGLDQIDVPVCDPQHYHPKLELMARANDHQEDKFGALPYTRLPVVLEGPKIPKEKNKVHSDSVRARSAFSWFKKHLLPKKVGRTKEQKEPTGVKPEDTQHSQTSRGPMEISQDIQSGNFRDNLSHQVDWLRERMIEDPHQKEAPKAFLNSLAAASHFEREKPLIAEYDEFMECVHGNNHNEGLATPKLDNNFSFPQNAETENSDEQSGSLECLISTLMAEDGKDTEPEVITMSAGELAQAPADLSDTDIEEGLNDAEVAARRKKYGWNRMEEQKHNYVLQFLSFFNGPVQWVMEVTVVLAGGLRDWIDFGIICALLLANAVVAFAQEYHAGNIVATLKKTLALRALVLRNGSVLEISSEEVVPGDIVCVEDGTIIPADGRLVGDGAYIQVDQSGITGESLAVDKHQGDPIFASSTVKRGTALMVVVATGDHTFVGNAAALVNKAGNTTGHFTQVLNGMASILLGLVLFTLLVICTASYFRSSPIVQILEFALAITVVGVPVGLQVVVTTTMAVGAAHLAKQQAIVQKLSAIESLAGVEILCSDKTGTLTRNRLTLGDPYLAPGKSAEELILTACLAANRTKTGIDPIDKVFIKSLRFYEWAKTQIASYTTVEFFPFDPVSKKVTAVVRAANGEEMICVKGAPMTVLRTVEEDTSLSQDFVHDYEAKVNEFASRGFRALGVARKRHEQPWEILGIVPCLDPPRHDTAKTIAEAQELGLAIKMLTGDAVAIARETARKLGLGTNIYNAERLGVTGAGSMPGSEINDFVEAADGFAEVYPQHKYSVVEILQRRGYLVAMTGDGVNDAASLKKADTGIAVEGASDAARSAADIVFLEPGLSAIIDAVKISRQIFHRMYAYVVYRIALSIHLELFLGLWMVIMNETLDLRLTVLLAIFADVATLTIAYDNASYSQSPVKWNQPRLWGESIVLGFILAVGTWVTFGTMLLEGEDGGVIEGWGSRDEVLFLEITLTQSWLILITRATGSGFKTFWSNRPSLWLLIAVLVVNLTGTFIAGFGVFGEPTHWVTIIRVWILAGGVTCASALAFIVMHNSQRFNNLMHGKGPRRNDKERSWEDFGLNMQRIANQHEGSK